MGSADYLLRLIKEEVDTLLASDDKLQEFLVWCNNKYLSFKDRVCYKGIALRTFYYHIIIEMGMENICHESRYFDSKFRIENEFELDYEFNITLIHLNSIWVDNEINDINILSSERFNATGSSIEMNPNISVISTRLYQYVHSTNFELYQELNKLQNQVPYFVKTKKNISKVKVWWQDNGRNWTEKLRTILIKHRNIGHNWRFTEHQKESLKKYYNANKLLVECLNSGCQVTPKVRQEIENTLLLPIAEIEKLAVH